MESEETTEKLGHYRWKECQMPVEERILRMSNNDGSYSGQYKLKGEIGLRRGKEPMVVRDISGDQNGS